MVRPTGACHPCYQSDGEIYDWMTIDVGEPCGIRACMPIGSCCHS